MILIACKKTSTMDTAIMKTIPRQTATLTVSQSTCREVMVEWLANVSFHHQNKPEVIRRKHIVQTIVSKQNKIKYLTTEQHTPKNSIKLWKCALLNITYYGWNYPGKRSNSVAVDTLLWQYRMPLYIEVQWKELMTKHASILRNTKNIYVTIFCITARL